MAAAITSNKLEARTGGRGVTLQVGAFVAQTLERTGVGRHREVLAEIALSSLTVFLAGFLFACLQHAVHICPIQLLP